MPKKKHRKYTVYLTVEVDAYVDTAELSKESSEKFICDRIISSFTNDKYSIAKKVDGAACVNKDGEYADPCDEVLSYGYEVGKVIDTKL